MAIIKYKGTDGEFKPLNNVLIKGIEVVQTTGTSEIKVMSQNAVTEIVTDISGTVSSHTANTDIHLTAGEKSELHTHSNKTALDSVTSSVGTMAYENASSYSSATEVDTAIGNVNDTLTAHASNSDIHLTTEEKGDLHSHSNKIALDSVTGSVGTMAYENASSYSSATEVNEAIGDVNDTLTSHTSDATLHLTSIEKDNLHGHTNKTALDSVTGSVGTMAYENASSYSSATQVNTALGGKSDTNHTHASNEITAMTNYTSGVTISPISTTDSLNTAIGKLEHSLGGIKLVALSQAEYDALTVKDPTTLYIVN